MSVLLTLDGARLGIPVAGHGTGAATGLPELPAAAVTPDHEQGRGLAIVAALCGTWEMAVTAAGGLLVRAELALPSVKRRAGLNLGRCLRAWCRTTARGDAAASRHS